MLIDNSTVVIVLNKFGAIGGSLQAFKFDRDMDIFHRVADGRFAMSSFYSTLALRERIGLSQAGGNTSGTKVEILGKLESIVSRGVGSNSALVLGGRDTLGSSEDKALLNRSHLEDRIVCALSLDSREELKQWLCEYVASLSAENNAESIRPLSLDLLEIFGDHEGRELVKNVVIRELARNRGLQSLAAELNNCI